VDNPKCKCGNEMEFLFDNKIDELWGCSNPNCGRVLLKQKSSTSGTFYKKEGTSD